MPTLAEQVAALEAERDEWRTAWEGVNTHRNQLRDALAAAESRLASARVEGARLQREAWVAGATAVADVSGCFVCSPRPRRPTTGDDAKVKYRLAGVTFAEHAARRYPAPAAPAGEPTRPATTPEPLEYFVVPVALSFDANGAAKDTVGWARITAKDCRRIVAIGSRPTQTAEG